jgi:uncharacterized protein (DUF983 family)
MKGTKVYSIFAHKCPRCHTGDLYYTSTFSFRRSFDMPTKCAHCGQKYVLETGFYYGAMFISYLLTAFLMFSLFAIGKFVLGFGVLETFAAATLIIFALYVWIFRTARAIWINFFVRYKPQQKT